MKNKIVTIPVDSDKIGILADPTNTDHTTYHCLVKISDLPLDMGTEVNPRAQNIQSRVAKQISDGLTEEPEIFYLRNRGLTVIAQGAKYDTKKKQLVLEINSIHGGVLDGGTSYAVIRSEIENAALEEEKMKEKIAEGGKDETENVHPPSFLDGYVKLEVIVGIKDELVVEIAQSRNTSIQVKDQSLANLEGSFDWLKELFSKTRFSNLIAYRENEQEKPIDIREIVCLLTLFHPDYQATDRPPMLAYSSRNKCLDLFRQDEKKYELLKPIALDILNLYDYVHLKFPTLYQEIGGIMGGTGEEDKRKTKETKLAKVIGIKRYRDGFPLYFSGEKVEFRFPDGYLYPCIAAMRGLVTYNGTTKWKENPFNFFNNIGKSLLKMTLETSKTVGRRPNAVGKSKSHWMQLHERVVNQYLTEIEAQRNQKLAA